MNRQMKRMMQRQGQVAPDGSAAPVRRDAPARTATRGTRTPPRQFLREVRGELRKVAWPSGTEVRRYSTVVLATLILLVALIFILDLSFSKAVLYVFDPVLN